MIEWLTNLVTNKYITSLGRGLARMLGAAIAGFATAEYVDPEILTKFVDSAGLVITGILLALFAQYRSLKDKADNQ